VKRTQDSFQRGNQPKNTATVRNVIQGIFTDGSGQTPEAGQPADDRPKPPAIEKVAAVFPQLEILEFIGKGGMGFDFVFKSGKKPVAGRAKQDKLCS
jgi:hypothetical protein